MDTKCLDEMAVEVREARGPLEVLREGLEDLLSLDLRPDTRGAVSDLAQRYSRRIVILGTLEQALSDTRAVVETLLSDGHPVAPSGEVLGDVLSDIRQNLSGMANALLKFAPAALTTEIKLTVGPEVRI